MHASLRLLSALGLAFLVREAHAGSDFWIDGSSIYGVDPEDEDFFREPRVVTRGNVSSLTATLSSDRGSEDLAFVEVDTWLHGAATIAALPKEDTKISVHLYSDVAGHVVRTFSGALGSDGLVRLSADVPTKEQATYDVELLAAEVFDGDGGYDISLDLHGADTYGIAYGDVVMTGNDGVTTRAEVFWDGVGAVWEADSTVAHHGQLELETRAYDAAGKKIDAVKTKLGAPWLDEGAGVGALSTDEDPLTSVAVSPRFVNRYGNGLDWTYSRVGRVRRDRSGYLTVVSEGWGTSDTHPTHAELELVGGDTVTVPANSYQRRVKPEFYCEDIRFSYGSSATFRKLYVNGLPMAIAEDLSAADLGSPACSDGTCLMITENEAGEYDLSVTAYAAAAADLPGTVQVTAVLVDEFGTQTTCSTDKADLGDELVVVFASELQFAEDPLGLDLSGKVSLLGAANEKGKQSTLAKGKFHGSFLRDPDGELTLAGADKGLVSSRGELVLMGDPIAVEQTDTNKDGVVTPPAAVAVELGGGAWIALGGPIRASR
ncbi:MAG: hypothetical protein V4850_28020 [Myxococcota bacterium]